MCLIWGIMSLPAGRSGCGRLPGWRCVDVAAGWLVTLFELHPHPPHQPHLRRGDYVPECQAALTSASIHQTAGKWRAEGLWDEHDLSLGGQALQKFVRTTSISQRQPLGHGGVDLARTEQIE